MKEKRKGLLAAGLLTAVLAVALGVLLTWPKDRGWTRMPEPDRDGLDIGAIVGFTPAENLTGGETGGGEGRKETRETSGGEKPGEAEAGASSETGVRETTGKDSGTSESEPSYETKIPTSGAAEPQPAEPEEPESGPTEPEPTVPPYPVLSDSCLTLTSLGGYTGNFLEDGSDDLVSNVAAILVTNDGDRMLQAAEVRFQVTAEEEAVFRITDLPAGATVLALELNRRPYLQTDDYSYGRTASAYIEAPEPEANRFQLGDGEEGKLTLKNLTGQRYSKVYVYYKYVAQGGIYLGGITYRVPFEDLGPGESRESLAGHYSPENSRVMAVVAAAQ